MLHLTAAEPECRYEGRVLAAEVAALMQAEGLSEKDALKRVARGARDGQERGLPGVAAGAEPAALSYSGLQLIGL